MANAVKDDLQELRQARSKDSLTIVAQDFELQKLSEKLTEQTEISSGKGLYWKPAATSMTLWARAIFTSLMCWTWTAKARTSGHLAVSFTPRENL